MKTPKWLGIGILVALGVWLFGRKAEATAQMTITPSSATQTNVSSSGAPTPQQTTSAIVEAVTTYPDAQTVHVVTVTQDYYVDVVSTTQAAEILGMNYQDWLLLYGYGIGTVGAYNPPRGATLYGNAEGEGYYA